MALIIQYLISGLALFASGLSIYFQFFHKPRRLRVISMPLSKNDNMRFGLCNGGKVNVFITALSVDLVWPFQGVGHQMISVGEVRCFQRTLSPGDIAEHSFELKAPPQPILNQIPLTKNDDGKEEHSLEIVAHVQFAFPDGKIYSNQFKLGTYFLSDGGKNKGFQTYSLNLDLIEGASAVA